MSAWNEFKSGKRKKSDVALFELHLEDNIFRLHKELISKKYIPGSYADFYICDPKRRHIHKASIRDRVLYQAVFRVLYPIFEKHFIYDSFSSRNKKGTHLGVIRLNNACRKVSRNWNIQAYVLKCDVRKFFDSIDHGILKELIARKISDTDALKLIDSIFSSFEKEKGKALPLGNVTSQLFANIYFNELDQFMKHKMKTKYYFRYCDDFVVVHADRKFLEQTLEEVKNFLNEKLLLELHPQKIEIRKVNQGIDFLGYVIVPHVRVIRTKTKKRILKKLAYKFKKFQQGDLSKEQFSGTINSYLGVFSHCRNRTIMSHIKKYKRLMKFSC